MRDKNLTQNCNKEIEKEVTQIISRFTIEQTVAAEEMTREEYVTSRGWELPEDEKHLKDEKVFKIYNEEGHISMLPKDLFLKIAKEISNKETITKIDKPLLLDRSLPVFEDENALDKNIGIIITNGLERKVKGISIVKVIEVELKMEPDDKHLMSDRTIKIYQTLDGKKIGTIDTLEEYGAILRSDYSKK